MKIVLQIKKQNDGARGWNMKDPDRKTVSRLDDLPNVGKAISADLELIGIARPEALIGRDPFDLYEALCEKTGKRQDPCVIDVFMSVISFMEGGEPLPWWSFTGRRKDLVAKQKRVIKNY